MMRPRVLVPVLLVFAVGCASERRPTTENDTVTLRCMFDILGGQSWVDLSLNVVTGKAIRLASQQRPEESISLPEDTPGVVLATRGDYLVRFASAAGRVWDFTISRTDGFGRAWFEFSALPRDPRKPTDPMLGSCRDLEQLP